MGASPMELVLMELRVAPLIWFHFEKQRQEITSFKAEVEGEQVVEAKPFKNIHVVFYLEGDIKEDKAAKPHNFLWKYCSVSKTLEPTATIHYRVVLNGNP
jgi:putative redox protein